MCVDKIKIEEKYYLMLYPKDYSKIINRLSLTLDSLIFVETYPKAYLEDIISNIKFLFKNTLQITSELFFIETVDNTINIYKYSLHKK
ncbi:hypothetical protein SAMN02745163_01916 [Clostridium cavendishii DSM 21758]|uniref:Uncharacterized protein n=1 Tax=Clostridium cavendishii DSM 21758 TaxID=1121302 RepID=A0A1M6J555_9CLOT|nr:hypothetical protein [Clostridium cavendishii]SHJ41777.1 hypothetical protein SAMN02745163_01916 [Clostridium cavendishii DSM 21758]